MINREFDNLKRDADKAMEQGLEFGTNSRASAEQWRVCASCSPGHGVINGGPFDACVR
jgi:hypothetical protein